MNSLFRGDLAQVTQLSKSRFSTKCLMFHAILWIRFVWPENCLNRNFMFTKSPTTKILLSQNSLRISKRWLNESNSFDTRDISYFKMNRTFLLFLLRVTFTITRLTGVIKLNTTIFPEERLGLTHKRPSYRPTGTHPSPRFVLVWRSANGSNSLTSTSRPTLCTRWSLTGNTAPPHWVVISGRSWLVILGPHCNPAAARKGLMLQVVLRARQKQE